MATGGSSSSVPREISMTFAAGVFGGLVNAGAAWLCGQLNLYGLLHCSLSGDFNKWRFYQHLIWGGIFGFCFLLPLFSDSIFKRGLVFGLLPAAFALLVVFPLWLHKGFLGVDFGHTTFLFVIALNLIWGLATAVWLNIIQ